MISIPFRKFTRARCAILVSLMMLMSLAANAELGGTVSTVQADQQRMRASRRVAQRQLYTVHEIHTETNATVREFVSPTGKVFAVTYHGQFLGEGNSLLAGYKSQVGQAMSTARGGQHRGGPVNLELPGLRYHATGHMRSYTMRAYLPESVPQGVSLEDLQ